MSEKVTIRKKFKFKVRHTYETEHIWEDESTVAALENFDRALSDGDLSFGEKLEKNHTLDDMPEPVCNNCGETPSALFKINCCQSPDYPHTEEDMEMLDGGW